MMGSDDVIVLEQAYDDMLDEKAFYESRRQGLGDYFWQSLMSDMASLKIHAGVHVKEYGFYRMKSKRFPYMVYYEKADKTTYVVAVLPIVRKPSWIRKKLASH